MNYLHATIQGEYYPFYDFMQSSFSFLHNFQTSNFRLDCSKFEGSYYYRFTVEITGWNEKHRNTNQEVKKDLEKWVY